MITPSGRVPWGEEVLPPPPVFKGLLPRAAFGVLMF